MLENDYVDFSELSVTAQIIFKVIENILFSLGVKEAKISKEELSWECAMSIPNVKIGLRELKQKGYIIAKNANSSSLRVGEQYEYKEQR